MYHQRHGLSQKGTIEKDGASGRKRTDTPERDGFDRNTGVGLQISPPTPHALDYFDKIFHLWNIPFMACEVEHTNEFGDWWESLTETEQEDVAAVVTLLESRDVRLGFPHSSGINGSRHSHMRELRIQSGGKPIRVFYAFDPIRAAILLIGGDKTGDDRFYERFVPIADDLYDEHLEALGKEGLI